MTPPHSKPRVLMLLALLTLVAADAAGQSYPPAQGPPLPDEPRSLGTYLIINALKDSIRTTVDAINARISREASATGVRARISLASFTAAAPAMATTQFVDRPNANVVRMNFIVTYDVTGIRYHGIPYFGRQVGQSIEVVASCHEWFTNQGRLRIATRADRPHLDGTSFGEDVLNFFFANTFADWMDSELRRRLPDADAAITDSLGDCNRLGVTPGTGPDYTDGDITFKKVRMPRGLGPTAADASVTFQSIKRLPARTLSGSTLYNDAEDIQVTLYANQAFRSAQLTGMREGDERNLTVEMVGLGVLGTDASLVLIGNVEQQATFEKDSGFRVFTRDRNFGDGTQKIVVQKVYWEPPQRLPDGRWTKPTEHRVDAYEITARVNAGRVVVR